VVLSEVVTVKLGAGAARNKGEKSRKKIGKKDNLCMEQVANDPIRTTKIQ
jgi:hypothetical protein